MLPAKHDFVIKEGSNFSRLIQWMQDDGTTPVNITGYTARMKIRNFKGDGGSALAEWDTDTEITIVNGSLGLIRIAVTAAATAALSFNRAVYDLELVDGDDVYCIMEGNVTLNKEVTI